MKNPIRILLFEDSKKYSESIRIFCEFSEQLYFIKSYEVAENAYKVIKRHCPDVVLLDIKLPGISGLEALKEIKLADSNIKILIQTAFEDDHKIFMALCNGASGYFIKSAGLNELEKAIYEVHLGGGYFSPIIALKIVHFFQEKRIENSLRYIELTKTEHQVLVCMSEGLSYKLIKDRLNKSYYSIHFHIKNIYKKLHVNSMTEAVVKAIKYKII